MRAASLLLAITACSIPDKQPLQTDAGSDGDAPGTVDRAPETTITAAPDEFSRFRNSTFEFSSDVPGVMFSCSIDGEPAKPCTSPFIRGLPDGAHSFSVRAIDGTGRDDDTPAEHLWTVDTVAPSTTLTGAPPNADNSVMVMFTFTSGEANVEFECSLDSGAYTTCTSGSLFGPIGDGTHAFAVRARDRAGNLDASPAIHAWNVDTSTPDTQLIDGPSGATASTSASFAFVSPDAGAGATFQCALDGSNFTTCSSPYQVGGLSEGNHAFAVRVRDSVGNVDPTPATRMWAVDLTPPDTSIDDGPAGTVALASASFAFAASEVNVTFTCSLDGSPFADCTSPYTVNGLSQGAHTFAVRATDVAGHVDGSPANRAWSVDTIAPEITISDGPAQSGTSGPRVTFAFTASEGAPECSVDSAPFSACASPSTFNAPAGGHDFTVRAVDAAGNTGLVTRTWTIACAAPDATGAAGVLHFDDGGQVLANATGGPGATLGDDASVEAGDPAVITGRFSGGLGFNASDVDHVTWPAAIGATSALTIELWARPDAGQGTRDLLVSSDGRVAVRMLGDGAQVRFSIAIVESGTGAARVVTSAPVAAGAWHHVLGSVGDPMLRLWVDGNRTQSSVNTGTPLALDGLRLGGNATTAYDGALDEIWLSTSAIGDDNTALSRYCPAP